jgi:rhodanese-related sulfurtransferase
MDSQTSPSISPLDLYGAIGIAGAPIVIDVRRNATFAADNQMIAGAVRRDPDDIKNWREELPPERAVVVYCVHGREVSQQAASTLRSVGIDARYLEHGISGWAEHRLPMRSMRDNEARSWVTRERPKIDRIACPWLIRRFIDPEAEFLFVPTERVFSVASEPAPRLMTSRAPSHSRTTASSAASMPFSKFTASRIVPSIRWR